MRGLHVPMSSIFDDWTFEYSRKNVRLLALLQDIMEQIG
jgi:hypothetical protein